MTLPDDASSPAASTVEEALAEARRTLAALEAPRLEASVLLAHALALPRTALIAHPRRPIAPAQRTRFHEWIERRANGEPLAWITGRREFRSLDLEVGRSTFVPRQETECLVEAVRDAVFEEGGRGGAPVRVAELGTGCGAVAVAIAHEAAGAEVVATDVDRAALAVARRNALRLAPGRIGLRHGSWCSPLEPGSFSVIASNPPYLRADDPHLRGDGLRHEPRHALVGGRDGLEALRSIARCAGRCLRPGGRLFLEHGADQGEAVRVMLREAGFTRVRSIRDLGRRERVTWGAKS